jgi:hypothetical protein
MRLPDLKAAVNATFATPVAGGPLAVLERGRATARLLRHPKLQPYMDLVSPHLPRLAPHAQRILDRIDTDLNPHIPILVEEALLPRLLPFMGELLDELPHLSPHLHLILPHRAWLLPCLDRLVPHLPALRPHVGVIARHMPLLAPLMLRLVPALPALLPHLGALLSRLDVLAPHLEELTSDELLPLVVPHLGVFAKHADALAPHLPQLLRALRAEEEEEGGGGGARLPRTALPPLLAALPELLPHHMAQLLAQAERIGPKRMPSLLGRPSALIDELRAHAPAGYYAADGSVAVRSPRATSSSSSSAATAAEAGGGGGGGGGIGSDAGGKGDEEQGGWLQGVLNFFGGGGGDGGANSGEAEDPAEAAAAGPPAADVVKVNAAIAEASKALSSLEDDFVSLKQAYSAHLSDEQHAAMRCAHLEATLADVDDGLVRLEKRTHTLSRRVEEAEAALTPQQLMLAREARQVEAINGRTDGLFSRPAWERGGPPVHLHPAMWGANGNAPPSPVGSPMRRSSLIEDDWLTKIAL